MHRSVFLNNLFNDYFINTYLENFNERFNAGLLIDLKIKANHELQIELEKINYTQDDLLLCITRYASERMMKVKLAYAYLGNTELYEDEVVRKIENITTADILDKRIGHIFKYTNSDLVTVGFTACEFFKINVNGLPIHEQIKIIIDSVITNYG